MRALSLRRRVLLGAVLAGVLVAGATDVALSQDTVIVSGKTYASYNDYLYGTWIWERQSPRQTMTMRFVRNKDFFYENFTTDLIHHGRFNADAKGLHVTLNRSCENKGKACSKREPPLVYDWPFKPLSADEFDANGEHWVRSSRD